MFWYLGTNSKLLIRNISYPILKYLRDVNKRPPLHPHNAARLALTCDDRSLCSLLATPASSLYCRLFCLPAGGNILKFPKILKSSAIDTILIERPSVSPNTNGNSRKNKLAIEIRNQSPFLSTFETTTRLTKVHSVQA